MTISLDLLDTTEKPDIAPNDAIIAKVIAEALCQHYPGQRWAITCSGQTGIITIRNLWLSGTYGYILKIKSVYSISQLKKDAVMAGGEVMERFNMERGRFDEAKYHTMKTDFAGRLLFERP